jgi:hypothetical protein
MNTKLFYKSTLRKISFHYAGPAWLLLTIIFSLTIAFVLAVTR